MTSEPPPSEYFTGIDFNPSFYQDTGTTEGLSETTANLLYLRKTVADTATAVETFNTGIKTNSIENVLTTDISNILINSTGSINIGTNASRSIANPILIGNATGTITRFGTANLQMSTSGTPTATLQAINTSGISVINAGTAFSFLSNHTNALSIGCNPLRTGNVLISNTQTTGTGDVVLGSNVITGIGTQNIICNRAITLNYLSTLQTSFSQLGYSNEFSTTTNPNLVSGENRLLHSVSSIPNGVYIITGDLITVSGGGVNIEITRYEYGITTVSPPVAPSTMTYYPGALVKSSEKIQRAPAVNNNQSITAVCKVTSGTVYFCCNFVYSGVGGGAVTLSPQGRINITRIG